jgi:hypothetical protein
MEDATLSKGKGGIIEVNFSEEFIKGISNNMARKMSEELFYEGMLIKNLPEIKAIEEGKIKAKCNDELIDFLEANLKKN